MASRKALTDEELLAQFEGIEKEDAQPSSTTTGNADTNDDDPLAELANLAKSRPAPSSRPATPRVSSTATSQTTTARSPKRGIDTPASSSGRTSEEKLNPQSHTTSTQGGQRRSGESTREFHRGETPEERTAQQAAGAGGGGWWGGFSSLASGVVKQAQDAYKEIQKNEEAQKWAEQVRGNARIIQGFGGELRSRAMPTFTNILQTLAPPISQHERLQIHITHDLLNYPSCDPLIYAVFSRVMSQVEGGDLLVIQRGLESRNRSMSDVGYQGSLVGSSRSGWTDGPWWRQNESRRDLGSVKGLPEGTKLARVQAETYATEFFSSRGGLEAAARQATENSSESNPVRKSDIFLALQPIEYAAPSELFAKQTATTEDSEKGVVEPETQEDSLIVFAVYLHDPVHHIDFSTLSQSVPKKWMDWLDAVSSGDPQSPGVQQLPEEIQEIIASGGVDPREWIAEWVEEIITIAVGIVAQRYVARRMGVGEGGIGRGKAPLAAIEGNAGEAARAGVI